MRPDPLRDGPHDFLWRERLSGLGLIALGIVGFGLAYLFTRVGPLMPTPPPGLPPNLLPILSPVTCVIPIIGIGSCGLVLIGLKRLLFPD